MIVLNKIGAASKISIERLEKKYNLRLPSDYQAFLLNTNGGSVNINEYNQLPVNGLTEKVVVDVLYGIDTGHEAANIDFWTDKLQSDLPAKTIIIGDSIMHGLFIMICRDEMQGIYYWDDSYHFETSTDENNTYWIADSFSDFMDLFEEHK
ncbi:SMI1/KNR4 family protein [Orbus wheelerorum]|uniref:SMI1/KNR4 family protein n=1 Tax=Orbus wheelerorum TaxID=3074111 RepID=UPI00370DB4A5